MIGAIVNLFHSTPGNQYSASLLVVVAIIFFALYYHVRAFPIKAQDRAIRAEENLRYFILTGKPMDSRITMNQIIALRFASDEELPELASRAANEGLSNTAIKRSIHNWRPDFHRA